MLTQFYEWKEYVLSGIIALKTIIIIIIRLHHSKRNDSIRKVLCRDTMEKKKFRRLSKTKKLINVSKYTL